MRGKATMNQVRGATIEPDVKILENVNNQILISNNNQEYNISI